MDSKKEKKNSLRKPKGLVSLIAQSASAIALAVALIVGTNVAFHYEAEISTVLTPPKTESETLNRATAEGQKLSARIVEEGTVLLRNEENALPLSTENDSKVNVFGWHSVDWLYGTGGDPVSSGGVLPEDDDFNKNIDLLKALNEYGIEYNEQLSAMYTNYYEPFKLGRGWKVGKMSEAQKLVEPDINDKNYYSDSLLESAKSYSNTALMVISRLCGEGANCPTNQPKLSPNGASTDNERHFLEISKEEEALLTYLGQNYEKVVVLVNTCNAFELGFLETIPGIDACLQVGYTGTRGALSLPKVLYGEISPSARLTDTYAYDFFTNPSNAFSENFFLHNGKRFIEKIAGIYIGYKWYETADLMGLWTPENGYENGYNSVVQYPFGYGLSYTDFEWTVDDIKIDGTSAATGSELKKDSKIEFTVTVKNIGGVTGKDVVEIYGTAPYTDGGIEKSAVELLGYGKTNDLAPDASETISVTVDMYDIASYDCYDLNNDGFKGYQLDQGDYSFKLMKNSHVINKVNYKDSKIDGEFVFNLPTTQSIDKDPVTGQTVKNLFTGDDAVDITPIDGKTPTFDPEIPWLTRASFYKPADFASHKNRRAQNPDLISFSVEDISRWQDWDNATTDAFGNPIDQSNKPTWGASPDKKLAVNGIINDLGKKLGASYDDPEWNDVLNQVTFDEALGLINRYYGSKAIDSVGKPRLVDLDGPTQIKGYNSAPRGTGYPSMVVIGQTFNQKLAYEFGQSFGNDMKAVNVNGLWGFACDLHLNAFFGRNNESPSEDPFLAGTTIAQAIKGLNTRGKYNFLKHFALYEGYPSHTFMTEQTLRETSLKAFRKAFVDGGALGTMTSYMPVGAELPETSQALITGVLRGEWQFKGAITTDANEGRNYKMEGLLRTGGNFGMGTSVGVMGVEYTQASSTARFQNALREAVHQILYTWLRADYNERTYLANPDANDSYLSSTSIPSWGWWQPFLTTVDIVAGCALAYWLIAATVNFIGKNKKEHVANEKNAK